MAEIEVGGHVVLADDDMAELVERIGLNVMPDANGKFRAHLRMRHLSNFIVRPGHGMMTDHVNGNTLDNRRENLQVISPRMNMLKRRCTRTPGVYVEKRGGNKPYRAMCARRKYAYFATLEEAQRTSDAHRRSLDIKGMPLNLPEVGEYGWDGTQRVS